MSQIINISGEVRMNKIVPSTISIKRFATFALPTRGVALTMITGVLPINSSSPIEVERVISEGVK